LQAAQALDGAAAEFAQCGAVWRVERTQKALAKLGHPGRRVLQSKSGARGLTKRERQVARLAAQGRTAAEIARLLFIGERTVETHLANSYAKLGVESKLDLVRRGSELNI
jgi:DNA-binding CsgD family transcriptional regulator